MRRTDPGALRKVAAELFVDMARDGDRIAVTGFDAAARQSIGELVTIDGMESRQRLKRAIRAIGNDGEWTDFTAGLDEARRLLASADDDDHGDRGARRTRIVVFLTDGKCEPGPDSPLVQNLASGSRSRRRAQAELVCQNHVLDHIAPALGESGARVHAVGLSRGAPAGFLEELGRRTGGQGSVTLDPRALPELFAAVYADILGSRLTVGDSDVRGGGAGGAIIESFEVLDGAQTCDVVIVGDGDHSETLLDPDGAEVPLHNRDPERAYFVGTTEYRFYKLARPRAGRWSLRMPGQALKSGSRRYAVLQHFDLELEYVAPPAAVERGRTVTLRARLASPGGTLPPGDFLDRHIMKAIVAPVGSGVLGGAANPLHKLASLDRPGRIELDMNRGEDGIFIATYTPAELGALDLGLRLEPRPDGVLSRTSGILATLEVVPPLHLSARAISLGPVKQDSVAPAVLSLGGSEVGIALELAVTLGAGTSPGTGVSAGGSPDELSSQPSSESPGGLSIDRASVTLEAGPDTASQRDFAIAFTIDRDAAPGPRQVLLRLVPTSPGGFDERAIAVPVTVDIVALTFWERYGTLVQYGVGGLLVLVVLLGVLTPARFKKRAILHYMDLRDPDLPRRSSYPIGTRARRGFYKAARIAVGPSGPVKRGGIVELRAASGGATLATPLAAGATVHETAIPGDDQGDDPFDAGFGSGGGLDSLDGDDDDDRPRIPLKDGSFRMAPGVGYQVASSELIFWLK